MVALVKAAATLVSEAAVLVVPKTDERGILVRVSGSIGAYKL